MTATISQAAVFAIFGVICLLGVAFIRNCVPETRGHTLEEIEAAGIRQHEVEGKAAMTH